MRHARIITAFAAGSLALLFCAVPAFSQQPRGHVHPWGGVMGGWGWIIFHALIWVLVAVALILVIRWLLQNTRSQGEREMQGEGPGRAMEVLKERYARGEIDREEFEQKKKDLS